ncbi:hypothetical protein JTB14_022888 [Gonioctena quinquepunctata]|nr:hypothetical protein JTB14_022888 [Gonioctena quinquepunctata]
MESFEISRHPRGNISSTPSPEQIDIIPSTPSAEQIDNIPSTPSAEQIDIPPNLLADLIPGGIPDNFVHGSQQEKEVSTEPICEVRPSRMQILVT